MKPYFIKTPLLVKKLFSKLTWCFNTNKKVIYLTFDDGPTPEITDFVLDQLNRFNAKATFFCIGKNIVNHPEIFNRIITEKHSVGNHTQNHLNGWKTSTKEYLDNINVCEKILSQKNIEEKLFRPPYGKIRHKQSKKILKKGYQIIMWDVLSADFDLKTPKEKCLKNVLKNTDKGSIVVFHDSLKASKKIRFALPKFLEHFTEKGFTFKAIKHTALQD